LLEGDEAFVIAEEVDVKPISLFGVEGEGELSLGVGLHGLLPDVGNGCDQWVARMLIEDLDADAMTLGHKVSTPKDEEAE